MPDRDGEVGGSSVHSEVAAYFERFVSVIWLWEPDYSRLR